ADLVRTAAVTGVAAPLEHVVDDPAIVGLTAGRDGAVPGLVVDRQRRRHARRAVTLTGVDQPAPLDGHVAVERPQDALAVRARPELQVHVVHPALDDARVAD